MDPDGKNERQLTNDDASDHSPAATPDGRYIVFVSNREGISKGNFNIWRMDVNGTNFKQLTNMTNADSPHCSPDSQWVIYTASDKSVKGNLWRVSINGGEPMPLTTHTTSFPVVSPDGRLIACSYWDETKQAERAGILPFQGGDFIKTFDISWEELRWVHNGRNLALAYVVDSGGVSNIWSQSLDGSPPKQVTNFNSEEIYSFDWSPTSNLLVCERGGEINNVVLITDNR
jgi:Tol biopolymer transport system component